MQSEAAKRDAVTGCLQTHGGLTRSELSKLTGIPRSVLSVVISDMLRAGSVVVAQTVPSSGRGRPAEVLRLRPNTPQYLGISLQTRRSYLLATDATYRPLVTVKIADHFNVDSATRVRQLLERARQEGTGLDLSYLQGAGLAVSGLLPNTDLVSPADSAAQSAQLAQVTIEEELSLPVVVEGTTRAAAVAEVRKRSDLDNCFYFRVSDGVGAAQISAGTLVTGAHRLAGEVGHITVDPEGAQCFCGKRGCLETLCSVPSLSERLGVTGEYGVVQAWEDGSGQARELLTNAVATAGRIIAQCAMLTDPGTIVVAWTLVQQIPQLLQVMKDSLDEHLLPSLRGVVQVEAALLPEANAVPLGAALLAAQEV
ncbi:MAG: ROK family protein [Actinomycetaceae bacterium]|nr:ROK family protein [Actinomycetaceae bacterium]